MLNSKKGYSLIMVLLVLFVVIIFITLSFSALMASSSHYEQTSQKRAEVLMLESCINYLNDKILNNEEKANLRIDNAMWSLGNENISHSVYYDYFNETSANKFMFLESTISNKITGIDSKVLGIKPIPLLEYAHFVVNPNADYGYNIYLECVEGGIRTNNQDSSLNNIAYDSLQKGKPHIFLQKINTDEYYEIAKKLNSNLAIDAMDDPQNIFISFQENQIKINNSVFDLENKNLVVIKNGTEKNVYISGNRSENGMSIPNIIGENISINLVTNSPIIITEEISCGNNSGLILYTTCPDLYDENEIPIGAAISFDTPKYVLKRLFLESGNLNNSSIFYGQADGVTEEDEINTVSIEAILCAENGSFGVIAKDKIYDYSYDLEGYNNDISNGIQVYGGIIEWDLNENLKNFDSLPGGYYNLFCMRNENFRDILSNEEFIFTALPTSSTLWLYSK